MAGFRADFAKMSCDSSDDEEPGAKQVKARMAARMATPQKPAAPENNLSTLRKQKSLKGWKVSEVATPTSSHSEVSGFRQGSRVTTPGGKGIGVKAASEKLLKLGGASTFVETDAITPYGASLAKVEPYQGPAMPQSSHGGFVPKLFAAPPSLPASRHSSKKSQLLLPRDDAVAAGKVLLAELNELRRDPPGYAERVLQKHRGFYDGLLRYPPRYTEDNKNEPRTSQEGIAAFDEAAAALRNSPALPALIAEPTLFDAAARWIASSPNEEDPSVALSACGDVEGAGANLVAKKCCYADEVILQLIVGDGEGTRRARRRLLDPKMTRAAAAASSTASTNSHDAVEGLALIVLRQTFRPAVDYAKVTYAKKTLPITDALFLGIMLALPAPLPRDLTRHIKAGAKVTIDYKVETASITVEHADGSTEEINVSTTVAENNKRTSS